MMKLLSAQFLAGPNVHHRDSVLVVACDFGEMDLLALPAGSHFGPLPGSLPESLRELGSLWQEARRSCNAPVDLMLHVALALQRDLYVRPASFATVLSVSGSEIHVALQCEIPAVGLDAWKLAVASAELFLARDSGKAPRLIAHLAESHAAFLNRATMLSLDQLTLALLRAAGQRDIPWFRIGYPHRFVQLGQGKNGRRLHETMLETTSFFAVKLTSNKAATHRLLERLAFPQPLQILVENPGQAVHAAGSIGYPVVVKPCHGGKGRGVSVGLTTPEQVRQAFVAASQGNDSVVVESLVAGDDHRLLVVAGRLVAAARRLPAFVTGDGRATIAELVAQLNRDPRRGPGYSKIMNLVDIDQEMIAVLAQQAMTTASVPVVHQRILLRRTANISRGGSAEDVTDIMHADNVRLAEDVARVVGLDVTGIDFLTVDIRRSWREVGGGIIEVNPNPGLRPHWIDNAAQRDVVGPILDCLLGDATPKRIPTVAVTGSIGKTTTCRMVARILEATGKGVVLSTTQGSFINGRPQHVGDHAGGTAAANLMLHPEVEAGVFEMARGGLVRAGMAIDRVNVAAVLNVLDNHLGLDGISSREDMARVKRIIAENAGEMVVLNADDPLCLAMRDHVRSRRLCLFSRNSGHPELASHCAAGGCAVSLTGEGASAQIVLAEGATEIGRLDIGDIPATLGGAALSKADNAAFALALAHGLSIPFSVSAAALRNFASTPEMNPGRMNLLHDLPFTALIDWTDGPVANAELATVARSLAVAGKRVLVLTAVGNRPDAFILASAKSLAGQFDRYICSNYTDPNYTDFRGRTADAVPELLRTGLTQGGVAADKILCAPDFAAALEQAVCGLIGDDLLVVASYSTDLVLQRLRQASA